MPKQNQQQQVDEISLAQEIVENLPGMKEPSEEGGEQDAEIAEEGGEQDAEIAEEGGEQDAEIAEEGGEQDAEIAEEPPKETFPPPKSEDGEDQPPGPSQPAAMEAWKARQAKREADQARRENEELKAYLNAFLQHQVAQQQAQYQPPTQEAPQQVPEDEFPNIDPEARRYFEKRQQEIISEIDKRLSPFQQQAEYQAQMSQLQQEYAAQQQRQMSELSEMQQEIAQAEQEYEKQNPGYFDRVKKYEDAATSKLKRLADSGHLDDFARQRGISREGAVRFLVQTEMVGVAQAARQLNVHPAVFMDALIDEQVGGKTSSRSAKSGGDQALEIAKRAQQGGATGRIPSRPGRQTNEVSIDMIREKGVTPDIMDQWLKSGKLEDEIANLAAQAATEWED